MLTSIDTQGNVEWDCTWQSNKLAPPCGAHNIYHISHDAVRWINTNVIEVPPCVKCGGIMSVRIPSEEEMTPPTTKRDETTKILQLIPSPGYEHFFNHWNVVTEQQNGLKAVKSIAPHAWVGHHQELARQLQSIGKEYTPQITPPIQQQSVSLEAHTNLQNRFNQLLTLMKEHGWPVEGII